MASVTRAAALSFSSGLEEEEAIISDTPLRTARRRRAARFGVAEGPRRRADVGNGDGKRGQELIFLSALAGGCG